MSSIHWADIVILAIIALSALISVWRGFLREVLSLLAWILAFWAGFTFGPLIAGQLAVYVDTPSIQVVLGFCIVFILTLIVLSVLGHFIVKLINKTGLTGTDRILGLLFGIARGGLIVLVMVLVAGLTNLPQDPWWQQSQLLAHFQDGAIQVAGYLPDAIAEHIRYDVPPVEASAASTAPASSPAQATEGN